MAGQSAFEFLKRKARLSDPYQRTIITKIGAGRQTTALQASTIYSHN
jgi:hypothetical protein